jgi:hypothetical protein
MPLRQGRDITTLYFLVRSSPLYHAAYTNQRNLILSTILIRDAGLEVLRDILDLQEATKILHGLLSLDRKEAVRSFLSRYKPRTRVQTLEANTILSLPLEILTPMTRPGSICGH